MKAFAARRPHLRHKAAGEGFRRQTAQILVPAGAAGAEEGAGEGAAVAAGMVLVVGVWLRLRLRLLRLRLRPLWLRSLKEAPGDDASSAVASKVLFSWLFFAALGVVVPPPRGDVGTDFGEVKLLALSLNRVSATVNAGIIFSPTAPITVGAAALSGTSYHGGGTQLSSNCRHRSSYR